MYKIFLVEETSFISEYLDKLDKKSFSLNIFSSPNEALNKIEDLNPQLVILNGEMEETKLLLFCRRLREKYSLGLPILLVLDFYSSFDFEKFRNLGVFFIVKPFTQEEFEKTIKSFLIKEELAVSKEDELINKLKPYIKEEVKSEIKFIFKQILEVMEQRDVQQINY